MSLLYVIMSSSLLVPELATKLVLVLLSIFHSYLQKNEKWLTYTT